MQQQSECQICIEKYNKTVRTRVLCPYCQFESCRACCKKYILNETVVKCMNNACVREWTREHIHERFPNSFVVKELKELRQHILFEQERALLPATQPIVEAQLRKEKLNDDVEIINKEIAELRAKQQELYIQYRAREREQGDTTSTTHKHNVFIRGCPDGECLGFLSSQWKCGICEKWTCPTCQEVKGLCRDVEHVCNPDSVATASLLSRDTKPCPNCRSGIFKIDGCDQMWCTQCHTAFSWRSGRIENAVHNPHYFEWLRRNGGEVPRNPLDIRNPCGGAHEVTHNTAVDIASIFRRIINGDTTYINNINMGRNAKEIRILIEHVKATNMYIGRVCEKIIHIRQVELPDYRGNHEMNNQFMRVRYMRKKITEEEFKINLQRQYTSTQKKAEMLNILQMVHDTCSDIVLRYRDEIKTRDWKYSINTLSEIDGIISYANDCLGKMSKVYSSKQKYLNNFLGWGNNNPTFPSLLPIPIHIR